MASTTVPMIRVPGTHHDIESAVKAAASSSTKTILLTPGKTYKLAATLLIKNSLCISIDTEGGAQHAVIEYKGAGPAVEYVSRDAVEGKVVGVHFRRETPKVGDGDVWLGAMVISKGAIVLEDCIFEHKDGGSGIVIHKESTMATLHGCEARGSLLSGVVVGRAATARLRDVTVKENGSFGIFAASAGTRVILEGGIVSQNGEEGFYVWKGASATIRGISIIRGNAKCGVLAADAGTELLVEGDAVLVEENILHGINIQKESSGVVRDGVQVVQNGEDGVLITTKGTHGELVGITAEGNGWKGFRTTFEATSRISGCTSMNNRQGNILTSFGAETEDAGGNDFGGL